MNLDLQNLLISMGWICAAAVWAIMYWRRSAPRDRQWLRYSLIISLAASLLLVWMIDSLYQIRVAWMNIFVARIELWLLIGFSMSLLSTMWLMLPRMKPINNPLSVRWASISLSLVAIFVGCLVALLAEQMLSLGALAVVGLIGVWRASLNSDHLVASLSTMAIALTATSLISFVLPMLWPPLAGHNILSWWSVLDVPSLALSMVTGFSLGSIMWWWLGQD